MPQPGPFDRYDAQLTTPGLVVLEMVAQDRTDAARQLAERLEAEGRIDDLAAFLADVGAREHQLATGLPGGIGLPHARSVHVTRPSIAVGVAKYGHPVDFGAADGPAHVVLLIATPASSYSDHLEVLATLARSLSKDGFRESLRRAGDAGIISELINSSLVFADH
ncbi:PTS sugar transporter subunit IIA [Sinomonas halotolerans]|uniref:PTS sugar transporter subunit IIA n=1 Tax=Sinomonas halotolerans TaxID=1644133 RepID=A0ABU9X5K5_9MICC